MERKYLAVGLAACLACSELGCVTRGQEEGDGTNAPSDGTVSLGGAAGSAGQAADKPKARDAGRGMAKSVGGSAVEVAVQKPILPDDAGQGQAETGADYEEPEPPPTGILIVTCESEPAEVALPFGSSGQGDCESVRATAYREDDSGSYEVSVEYSWFVGDPTVVQLLPTDGKPQSAHSQRPKALLDIFSAAAQDAEPETALTVCVDPIDGWPDAQQPSLCKSLTLRTVPDLAGKWCFTGDQFETDCDLWILTQDGRNVQVEHNGAGTIKGKAFDFEKNGLRYAATLGSADDMAGEVFSQDTAKKLGTWSAWRYGP